MEPLWIATAFTLGFLAKQLDLPPLVGFLAAGFALNGIGVESTHLLEQIADLGIYLLLFSIGLKLDVRSLARTEIWATASLHMIAITATLSLGVFALATAGFGMFAELTWQTSVLIAFALSFSSTVFAVKVLEARGESTSRHGIQSIGVLITQDIFVIIFLTVSLSKIPSPWALLLLATPLLRRPLHWIVDRSGHGEVLVLLGLVLVFCATEVFEILHLKQDLGALLIGVFLGRHPKSKELANSLLSFKDFFLLAFFLSVGLSGIPSTEQILITLALVPVIPLKGALFFWLMTRQHLRVRTAWMSSLTLSNFSEFGLIVCAVGAGSGWISHDWLVLLALALSLSFVIASPFNTSAHILYARYSKRLAAWKTSRHISGDEPIRVKDPITVGVIGMGRVGTAAYDALAQHYNTALAGLEANPEKAQRHKNAGRRVIVGDATNPDFYEGLQLPLEPIKMLLVTVTNLNETITIVRLLRGRGFKGHIAAIAEYPDEAEELLAAGVDQPCYLHHQLGIGLAEAAACIEQG